MLCPACRTDNPVANRFCHQCGEPLEARCPQCATVLRAGARFCGACGHRLTPAATTERSTGSAKYLDKCHPLRGAAQRWNDGVAELTSALEIARRIEYPTLAWQAAHRLAQAQAAAGKMDDAAATARIAQETIDLVAARAPDPALRQTFTNWTHVQTAREDLARILR